MWIGWATALKKQQPEHSHCLIGSDAFGANSRGGDSGLVEINQSANGHLGLSIQWHQPIVSNFRLQKALCSV